MSYGGGTYLPAPRTVTGPYAIARTGADWLMPQQPEAIRSLPFLPRQTVGLGALIAASDGSGTYETTELPIINGQQATDVRDNNDGTYTVSYPDGGRVDVDVNGRAVAGSRGWSDFWSQVKDVASTVERIIPRPADTYPPYAMPRPLPTTQPAPSWVPILLIGGLGLGAFLLLRSPSRAPRHNIAAGYWSDDDDGRRRFHPIRASYDYSRKKAGERPRRRSGKRKRGR